MRAKERNAEVVKLMLMVAELQKQKKVLLAEAKKAEAQK